MMSSLHYQTGVEATGSRTKTIGLLSVAQGFRYEPVQTEFENALGNGNKPSDIRAKYDLP